MGPGAKKNSSKATKEKEVNEVELVEDQGMCPECNSKVADGQQGIACDVCEYWYHPLCVGIDEDEYKILSKPRPQRKCLLSFICSHCKLGSAKIMQMVRKISMRQDGIERKVANCEEQSKENHENIEAHNQRLETLEAKEVSTEADVVKKAILEMEDRQGRHSNFIIHGVQESSAKEASRRIEHDQKAVADMLNHFEVRADFHKVISV